MSERKIAAWEILNHGMEHEQYFQGCGVSHTDYTDIATGIGDNAREAYDDALEQLACAGWDTSRLPRRPRGINAKDRVPADVIREMGEMCDAHIYVSVRVRGPKARPAPAKGPEGMVSRYRRTVEVSVPSDRLGCDPAERLREEIIINVAYADADQGGLSDVPLYRVSFVDPRGDGRVRESIGLSVVEWDALAKAGHAADSSRAIDVLVVGIAARYGKPLRLRSRKGPWREASEF